MKQNQMDSLARSLCNYLASRNNDIAGYWGIGMLCAAAKRDDVHQMRFRIVPRELIHIYGCDINDSRRISDKAIIAQANAIAGRVWFERIGRYDGWWGRKQLDADKYTCSIAIAITQGNRIGMGVTRVLCWPHDPHLERRRGVSLLESRSAERRGLLP